MSIGGFNGTDPAPSLAQFEAYVAAGDIHYFIGGGGFGGNGGSSDSSEIATWVAAALHRADHRRHDGLRPDGDVMTSAFEIGAMSFHRNGGVSSGAAASRTVDVSSPTAPVLDLVIPVYNEQVDLAACVRRLHEYLRTTFPYPYRITIADNASTDATPAIAAALAETLPGVTSVRFEEKGRGRALHAVWSASEAPILAYMDVDLSTDLAALLAAGGAAHLGPFRPRHRDRGCRADRGWCGGLNAR